ncbi:Piezo-type mechanosensitive ion channel component 1 [Hypsibius exemplaris]|uniref:Piezo-type mechanosensitive ion channel component 1 n=1 Tax=Hypsibius exemplaris TaxID=2072580 RepID=A0A1W0X1X0_HYPEX|nr:Piezo-type mechanosensitive ion channel component 1 [Hypsibius exemplaris]
MTERIQLINWVTFRLILPFTLLAACIFRFNLFTLIYGLFFLLVPLARSPNVYTIKRHTGGLIWALTTVSGIFMLAQIAFQIALAARKPYGHEFPNCSLNDNITRQVGLYRLDGARFVHVARLILPDVIVFIVSAALAVMAFQTTRQNADAPSNADEPLRPHREERPGLLRLFVELVILIFVAGAGIISPSLISSVYFLCFLFMGTFWACLGNAEKVFVKFVRYALLLFCAAHLAVLFLYQMEFLQELVTTDSFPSRLVGLLAVIRIDCSEPRDLRYQATPWYNFINPAILIVLYYLLASHIRQWKGYTRLKNPFLQYRVLSADNPNQRPVTYNAVQDAVTIQPPSPHSETSLHHYRIRMALQALARVIAKQSYIISLISMMAWSVIYHSWLTFVYLLLAIFLWLIPSSRSFCLKLSPLYTLYAEVLLIAQFIFSLNIQQEFDAMEANTYIDFKQIGFQRSVNPVFNLAVQSLFTFFFWTTLRLFMKERRVVEVQDEHGVNLEIQNGSVASEFAYPETHSWLTRIGTTVKIVMIKFWIVLCGAMLLVISMQGKVVIYRIVYMALLLCFVVMLQVSYRIWRKMLYVFWVTVIFYSMVVLLLIYTYQFKYFPEYWQNFTRLSPETLSDFGLETYESKGSLILGLMTPTAFLILCILQLHYFHKHFLHITSKQDGQYQFPSFQLENQPTDLAKPSGFAIRCLQFLYKWSHIILDFGWRLLEIHILKLCLLTILLAAVVDPSASI